MAKLRKKITKHWDAKHKNNDTNIQATLSSEPAREARQCPECWFELRRANRAGAQTGIRLPRA